ncbi:MAG: 2Fe-2S iron-sulfur cluster binding domain-containing protein [Alphaproteobacteria bacterium]|nr:2Fe-2S iron-sulfur cluster binding domain-containing protein [Alphaproteobacteria bacterium]MBU1573510.1 2Fe-2S iron-sulfur cluster binding domain-containing protein [Alphaproteobacteria bacterium]MBU2079506.1 2Fe-2S iron-sulfur cluster binding domain-containing protein [Alphaproteobacteria bacterium]MBU2161957.1 2Fe-2S iron-sulfur cluster binding domain-containing protein [Alphaproteobacteria bacterium]MBU2242584.1 2Fe-2S iron-sulfur cluster binding domain-containing protein [Alphaproteobac
MTKITFVQPDGRSQTVSARVGDSVMQTALAHSIDGIFAECGGAMMCATCHCYVEDARTGEASQGEEDLLDCAEDEVRPSSRLSCQIKVTEDLDGLVVHLPVTVD